MRRANATGKCGLKMRLAIARACLNAITFVPDVLRRHGRRRWDAAKFADPKLRRT
jgi:hypothetical protein